MKNRFVNLNTGIAALLLAACAYISFNSVYLSHSEKCIESQLKSGTLVLLPELTYYTADES